MMVSELLRALVEREGDAMAAVLHHEVRFRQGDGSLHVGRAVVLAMFERSERDVRYRVLEAAHDTVRVALEVPGVEGMFSFLLCGRAHEGRLIEVWVEQ